MEADKDVKNNVVVLGASSKPNRYSNQAVALLLDKGYNPIPVHPRGNAVHGLETKVSLKDVSDSIHTVTLYVNKARSTEQADDIFSLKPQRIIFNPGAENPELKKRCEENGIETVEGCTLVMLRTEQF